MSEEINLLINKPIESDLSNWYINDIQLMKGYLRALQDQLEEKDKVINEYLKKIKHVYNMLTKYKENHIICFNEDLWGLYQRMNKDLVDILESDKDVKD